MIEKYIRQISGGTLINYVGNWVSGHDYVAGDYVLDSGAYLCIAPHTSSVSNRPPNLSYWVSLGAVIASEATEAKLQATVPLLEFIDGSSNDAVLRLNAGVLELYDNVGDAIRSALNILTGDLTIAAPKTDHQIIIPISPGAAIAGTWTASAPSNVLIVTRTAAVGTGQYRMLIPLPVRTSASKGAKLKSVTVCYTVGSADTSADQLLFNIVKQTMPENGSSPVGSILAGDVDADYDANHDTKAERLAAATHTATVTIPSEEQAYASDGEQFYLDVLVTDAATANLTFAIKGAVANFDMAVY